MPGQNSTFLASSFSEQGLTSPQPVDATQATFVILAYTAAFVLLAALLFRRRDMN